MPRPSRNMPIDTAWAARSTLNWTAAERGALFAALIEMWNRSDRRLPADSPTVAAIGPRAGDALSIENGWASCPTWRDPDEEHSPAIARRSDEVDHALEIWNRTAAIYGLPLVRVVTTSRRRLLALRLDEIDGIAGWERAMERIGQSKFLRNASGANRNGWVCTLDFLLQQKSLARVIEGVYGDKELSPINPTAQASPLL